MSAINNDEELERLIREALGENGDNKQILAVKLLCKDLLREVVDECREKAQAATNSINDILRPN